MVSDWNRLDQDRVDRAVGDIDFYLKNLLHRPGMITGSHTLPSAEMMLVCLLDLRGVLHGLSPSKRISHREWCRERYPHIPGKVRDISRRIHGGWGTGVPYDDDPDHVLWVQEAGAFIRDALTPMADEETIEWVLSKALNKEEEK